MKFTEFKKIAKKKSVHLLIDLDSLEQVKEGQKILVKDHRTVQEENRFKVKPVAVTESGQFYVVCPICKEVHVHGLGKASDQKGDLPSGVFCGSRVSHCHEGDYDFRIVIA
ncbi:MAG: hypothetical protein IKS90_03455 [Clostridia bacterium]|nr:hypothetical protein [Clostridia bacterium]